jgi:hypothetical protein
MQQYSQARVYLEKTLAQEAEEKIKNNAKSHWEVNQKINEYNQFVSEINSCLQSMQLFEHLLPTIADSGVSDEHFDF